MRGFEEVVATLWRAGLSPDGRELAEALWLAQHLGAVPALVPERATPRSSRPTPQESETPPAAPGPAAPPPRHNHGATTAVETEPAEATLGVAEPARDIEGVGVPFQAPRADALPHARELARALRPLKRRMPSSVAHEIDHDATIDRIAETGICIPAMRRARRVPFELALVVDAGRSMDVWRGALRDLFRTLSQSAAFGAVTLWSLDTDAPESVTLRRGAFSVADPGAARGLRALCDPRGRRVVALATDCVSPAWHTNAVAAALHAWGGAQPVALLQVLARPAWLRTALRRHHDTSLTAGQLGLANRALTCATTRHAGEVSTPVIAMSGCAFGAWSSLLLGRRHARVDGALVGTRWYRRPSAEPRDARGSATGRERVDAFRTNASPKALQLVARFAAAPVLTLPVMEIVRASMLREANTHDVAEVLLGGLLVETKGAEGRRDPDRVQYEFIEGAREALLESMPVPDTVEVLAAVSRFVAKEIGAPIDFRAVLRGDVRGLMGTSPMGETFARVSLQVLEATGLRPRGRVRAIEEAEDDEEPDRADQYLALERLLKVAMSKGVVGGLDSLPAYVQSIFAVGFARLGSDARGHDLLAPIEEEEPTHDAPNRMLLRLYRARYAHAAARADADAWRQEVDAVLSTVKERRVKDRVEWLCKRSEWLRTGASEAVGAAAKRSVERALAEAEARPERSLDTLTSLMDDRSLFDFEARIVGQRMLRVGIRSGNDELLAGLLGATQLRLGRLSHPGHRAELIGECLRAAAVLHDSGGVDELLDAVMTLVRAPDAPATRDLVTAAMPGLAALQRLGNEDSAWRFLDALVPTAARGLREGVRLRAALAEGFLLLHDAERADALLDEALDDTLAEGLDHVGRHEAGTAVLAALRHWPMAERTPRCERILESLGSFTDSFTAATLRVYETHKILIVERVVDAIADEVANHSHPLPARSPS